MSATRLISSRGGQTAAWVGAISDCHRHDRHHLFSSGAAGRRLDKIRGLTLPASINSRIAGSLALVEGISSCSGTEPVTYHRLNERYRVVHSLCRLLLENLYAAFSVGQTRFSSFLINMEKLFEAFVAAYLKLNLRPRCIVRPKKQFSIHGGRENTISSVLAIPDIVISDSKTDQHCLVLDTKYKVATLLSRFGQESARNADFYQVLTYAVLAGCPGILVYPQHEFGGSPVSDTFKAGDNKIHVLTVNLNAPPAEMDQDLLEALKTLLRQ